ncbi:MAG: peptidyl-prolyl cis-trans isomerase [Magnetococcales bacterium]|nr:peptidyl-prolyl cis-trans isomerase [Magnetococcales bacterium]
MNPIQLATILFTLILGCAFPSHAQETKPAAAERPPFAVVDGVEIPADHFIQSVQQGARQRFYHGKIPDDEMAKFQREMGQALVERLLLVKEAKRQGLQPDQSEIQRTIAEYDQRYATSPRYQTNRESMLGPIVTEMADRSLATQLQEKITRQAEPTKAELLAFYNANPDKFTEPEDLSVSVILLKVDPSAGSEAWENAKGESGKLVQKLKEGADFAELARIHSGDASAAKGGRMDYVHAGMLSEDAEQAIARIQPGQFTDAILVLEGYAIFRLDKRTPPHRLTFDEVKDRAKKLYLRDNSETQWKKFRETLWKKASVKINESYYLPLPEAGKEATDTPHPHAMGGSAAKKK